MTDAFSSSSRARLILSIAFLTLLLLAAAIDQPVATAASHLSERTRNLWWYVSDFGLSGYMFVISALITVAALMSGSLASDLRQRLKWRLVAERGIAFFFMAIGLSGIAVQILKHIIGRARPKLIPQFGAFHFEPFSLPNTLASFPSGHTTSAFSAAMLLSLIFPRTRYVLFALAVAIGIARVCVGDHYPSDLVAGAALGSSVSLILARIMSRDVV